MGLNASQPSCSAAATSKLNKYSKPPSSISTEDLLVLREKKKKRTGLSTFKKKIVGRRKNYRAVDHAKHFKDAFSCKPISLLSSLLEHYQVLLAMRDLKIQADLARPPAPSLQLNLENLFVHAHCPDFKLIYLGTQFSVHKSILLARCPYFKDLLLAAGSLATDLTVKLSTSGVDVSMFSSLLRFLYTGEYPSQEMTPNQIDLLISLGRECGVPNLLEADLEHLYQSGEHTDCILVFTGDKTPKSPELDPDLDSAVQLSCHKAVLCARSPFFRNLVSRRLQAAAAEKQDRGSILPQPLRIVLDESVIPQKYARVLVRALYVDSIDFDLVDDRSVEIGDRVRDGMELYQIGRFLDLDILAQNSEDAIVHRLNQNNIVEVLDWSGQPYGSAWVHRQAMQYLLEDFVHVTSSPALEKLNKDTLRSIISSDFIQASESEILATVIRWGELVVSRRGEGEGTSLPTPGGRRSARRRDGICDREVAEVVCDLVGCIRLENMLGGGDLVRQAAERGLLSRPWYMGGGGGLPEPWDPRCYRPPHQRPRLFLPYYEECKALYSERAGSLSNESSSFNFHRISDIPDTLYMVRDDRAVGRADPDLSDQDNVSQMVRRVRKLYRSLSVQRALLSPFANRQQIFIQLQLRVVRESNLPDSFSAVLQRAMDGGAGAPDTPEDELPVYRGDWEGRRRHASLHYLPSTESLPQYLPALDQPLSDTMPDIAMASSAFGSLTLTRSMPSPRNSESRISPRPSSLAPGTK
ncbi:BTB/POZ domain-containing protein 7 [Eurytemora carolleeae]|uniref:BTB/POZ domain-containing protein 7 n=1 Tax=Eurytemora carolleeae TaxID=1294199 RepID=UPI000C766A4E|nr:BTB/POZ domain-containing protein 7 [Eurytemora carolleeae]|eukprot:XP_023340212.1 BTB/POZ domain-containing protein 7-like [Eurytemora affinis]